MKYKNQSFVRHIARPDVIQDLFNIVFAYAQTGAKTQTFGWARWRRCRWQNAANIYADWNL